MIDDTPSRIPAPTAGRPPRPAPDPAAGPGDAEGGTADGAVGPVPAGRPPAAEGTPTPDELLVARAAEGDEEAFEVLVRRRTPELLRLAHRLLGSTVEAEDAVQEAFVSAWRRLPEFRRDAAFSTWMYRIVTNRCLNVLRARRPTAPLEAAPEPVAPEHASSPARAAESAAAARALSRALAGLTPEQRACWVLRELHGLSYDDIAAAVCIGEPAVRGRIFRARKQLTEAMAAWRPTR